MAENKHIEIERSNKILVDKLSNIMCKSGLIINPPMRKYSLNIGYRQKIQKKIMKENYVLYI